ncbi:protein phosphatase 2C domain-containing protein [Streptomyces sp. S.PNR 29]|uniref:protein phosphatase 2C domain-containing protein n=1 Tax=Streptomyces sp. S.PNR 29 TaxID=2973805 RepID=UPI0025B1C88C|nr:protein phosphatase 2C domain-containing protein [Streptomyces sp. S.PNR 29]MDN0200619.1 protein phosphatase 2C domain-containing protein [Streptomyces sp. S.PNR 29]
MSQQGGRRTGHEDDWWGQLYDDSTGDTGPAAAGDSLDDRFASAAGAVNDGAAGGDGLASGAGAAGERAGFETGGGGERPASGSVDQWVRSAGAGVPPPRAGDAADVPPRTGPPAQRAPWEPPPATPMGPVTFPPGPQPPEPPAAPPARNDPERVSEGPDSSGGGVADAPPARQTDGVAARGSTAGTPAPAPLRDDPRTTVLGHVTTSRPTSPPPSRDHVGSGPPTYDAEPTALPPADPDDLDALVADTVLDGARYGSCTLRAVSVRGDSARYRGEPRRDSLLTARFGAGEQALLLIAMATGVRATPRAHRAAAEACHWIGRAVGRSHARLVEDLRAARRGDLKSGLHRLTDRSLGRLRASAAEQGIEPEEYSAALRCLLLPADPDCRTRVFFGVGGGGLFRLRDGEWQDIEPRVADVTGEPVVGFGSVPTETPEGDRLTMDLGITTPPSPYEEPEPPREPFRFRASVARPGDVLLMCTAGLADPLRGEPELCEYLAARWSGRTPPGLAAFLADSQVRVKGYADDRTAAGVWDA